MTDTPADCGARNAFKVCDVRNRDPTGLSSSASQHSWSCVFNFLLVLSTIIDIVSHSTWLSIAITITITGSISQLVKVTVGEPLRVADGSFLETHALMRISQTNILNKRISPG